MTARNVGEPGKVPVIQIEAQCATDERYHLAEGPVWDGANQRLLWVDIPHGNVLVGELVGRRIRVIDQFHVDITVGAVAVAAGRNVLVAGHHAVYLRTEIGTLTEVARLVDESQDRRLNDGKCDPAGRFLVGTLNLGSPGLESLFQIAADGGVTTIDDDLQMSNGLAWSPDGRTLYSVDTIPGIVWERPYDPVSGGSGERRELIRVTDGSPDGICVDVEGCLWVAVWGTGQVRRFTLAGELVAVVHVDAPYASCVTFGGPDLDVLVISTAIDDLTANQRLAHPQSGGLFTADVGVRGLPMFIWAASSRQAQS